MKNLFGKRNAFEFEQVGTEEIGSIYLLKRDRLKVRENPVAIQEADRRQAKVIALIGTAVSRLASEKNMTEEEANECFFPSAQNGVTVMPRENLTAWLNLQEKTEFYEVNSTLSTKYAVATLFIQCRLGWHVEVTEPAKAKAASLEVAPLRWEMPIGSRIQFNGFTAELTEAAELDAEILYVKPLPQKVDRSVGFLVDPVTNHPKVGMDDWTDRDTSDLDEAHVDAIYAFYQEQSGLTRQRSEGKQPSQNSEDLPNQSRSIGSIAGSESNDMESLTPSLDLKTLEIATVS